MDIKITTLSFILTLFYSCTSHFDTLSVDEILAAAEDGEVAVLSLSQGAAATDLMLENISDKEIKYVKVKNEDTILLHKLLGCNSYNEVLVFNKSGLCDVYGSASAELDIMKINNTIRLYKLPPSKKFVPDCPIDTMVVRYNFYGLCLLFERTEQLENKRDLAKQIWFNSTKDEKSLYREECL